jgi:hypothetical protein
VRKFGFLHLNPPRDLWGPRERYLLANGEIVHELPVSLRA